MEVLNLMKTEFGNVEILVLLDWLVADFESKFARYHLTGDQGSILRALNASIQGRTILARMKEAVQQIAKKLNLDLDQETLETKVNGNQVSITWLSFGVEAQELVETYSVAFIKRIVESEMSLQFPLLRFKLFYLPALPIATTEQGHIMDTIKGFTSIRRKRIEINVYPPRNYETIFSNIVHEILHVCFLEESTVKESESVEGKIKAHVKTFFDTCKDEWCSERTRIVEDLKKAIEKKLSIFEEADTALVEFHTDLRKAKSHIRTFMELFDAVADGKVKLTLL